MNELMKIQINFIFVSLIINLKKKGLVGYNVYL